MGRFLPQFTDEQKREIAEKMKDKMVKECLRHWRHIGHVDVGLDSTGDYYVSIENGLGQFSDLMSDIVRKTKNAVLVSAVDYDGSFDWASDTYCKDCSIVTFKL